MAKIHIFTRDEIDAIRGYCETQLRDEVARLAVVERDHGACVGVIVELIDGLRLAVAALADGNNNSEAGKQMVADLRRRMSERRGAMH